MSAANDIYLWRANSNFSEKSNFAEEWLYWHPIPSNLSRTNSIKLHMLHFRNPENPTNQSHSITLIVIVIVIVSVEMPVNVNIPFNMKLNGGAYLCPVAGIWPFSKYQRLIQSIPKRNEESSRKDKESMFKASRRRIPLSCINQLLQKQHNQGSTMLSSWSIVVHLVTLWSFQIQNSSLLFSLGSFVSDENISNSLSLFYRYLGASWLQAKSKQICKENSSNSNRNKPKNCARFVFVILYNTL